MIDQMQVQESSARSGFVKKAVIACVAAVLMFCVAFCCSGCKPPEGQLAANAAVTEVAAIEKQRWDALEGLPQVAQAEQLQEIGISTEEFYGWWLEGFKWELGDLDINLEETDADIQATLTCRPLEPIVKQWSNEYVEWLVSNKKDIKAGQTEDPLEYGRLLLQNIFENTEPTVHECAIHVHKYDDTWSVVGSPENGIYKDALLGSADNLSGYYEAPLAELKNLGVKLMPDFAEGDQVQ